MANTEKSETAPTESVETVEVVPKPQEQADVGVRGGRKADSGDDHDVQRFLMIDRGEDIIKQLETASRQYKQQVVILTQEVDHIWNVLRSFMLLFGPLLVGIVLIVMAKCTLPRGYHQNIITSLFVGVFTALVAFRYPPFHSSVEKYLSFRDSKDPHEMAGQVPLSSDSETSTDQEPSEDKDEAKTNTANGKTKSEYFDMLPEPIAL